MARSRVQRSRTNRAISNFVPLLLLTSSSHAASPYRVWPGSSNPSLLSRQTGSASSSNTTEIRIRNSCSETIWPGVGTQAGKGPETNGFELAAGSVKTLKVSDNWQGRIWGRTNCSFNEDGTRSANGQPSACGTGDCFGVLNCVTTVRFSRPPLPIIFSFLSGRANNTRVLRQLRFSKSHSKQAPIMCNPSTTFLS